MTGSYICVLKCPKCKRKYNIGKPINLCECGSPLLASYDLEKAKKELRKEVLLHRSYDIWRYKELLPVENEKNIISLGEGYSPLLKLNNLGFDLGLNNLYLKDESFNPTHTFKARGAAVGISKIRELGITEICMPTAGNAGDAWSSYSTKAGVRLHLAMPVDAPELAKKECIIMGADVHIVDGLISDAAKVIAEDAKKYGWFEVTTLKEPYRIEGKKTMGLEILEQLNWEVPDVILHPVGGGVGIIGIWKAIKELEIMGWIRGKKPRMVAVQAENCAPIVKAFEERKTESEFWVGAKTLAGGIRVPKPLGDFLILEAIYESEGSAVAVNDEEIKLAIKQFARSEGILVCPEGAANVVAIRKLRKQNFVSPNDKIILVNTGSGLKYPHLL